MKKLNVFLALVSVMIFSLSFVSEAQTMNNDRTLNARQQSIVTIAAFSANGDMEDLSTALNEELDAGLTVNENRSRQIHCTLQIPDRTHRIASLKNITTLSVE